MAKKIWEEPIDKNVDWGGDASTNNLPVSGQMVQKFIKDGLDSKAGIFHYDTANNRYIVFSDTIARDEYLLDPTQTHLIIGTFDAPFNYTATINLTSKAYNAVFLNSTGNYIDFTFDVVNKQGASTGENVTVTYTIIRNANKQVVTETKKFGDVVHFNIDKYLGEGTNTIMVGITGQTSLAATTVAITYQVVNLSLTDDINIAKSYNIINGPQQVEIPFTVSGYGTKVVEWYIDGELLPFVKSEDEVVDVSTSRTKYITLSNLSQGAHSLQIRAYTVINGEHFYTDTLYRDLLVYTGTGNDVIIGIATTIPRDYGIIPPTDVIAIYDIVQYVPYTLRFATYSPLNAANTDVTISIDDKVKGVVGSKNGTENLFVITSTTYGSQILKLSTTDSEKEVVLSIKKTTMNIQEIEGAVLDFTAHDKTNGSTDRDTWTDGIHTATLTGFNWNNSSGWVNGRLEMSAGSSLAIDYAPLGNNPTGVGKTIEIEWKTKNVTNDNAVICDLRGENGVGILITATKVSMISADGVVIETEYKSDENVRIGFIINKSSGVTNRRLSFIYTNGIVSRAEQWATTDNYNSDAEILFTATNEAEISLKSIKVYDNALSSDNMLNNFILYRDTISEMMEVYDRNDVYEEGTTTFSPEKMMNRLPVMIVTGDIPTLENTSDKNEQIVVDIEYYNMQYPEKSFTMKNAAMRPQGTSSMGYPKKNFRIYTEKVANTELYDANGNLVEDKLYAFKPKSQPVNCWCLKADYAESSGTHNTGIARLWNEALYNAQIDGEYKFRTEAQKAAIASKYDYDVRTTVDGFPILLFYRPKVNDDLIFIGKYNFNNDKSTEKVFGFTDIPGFDNSRMQCWEILNNGNPLALFTRVDNFDSEWSEAFESRYPDTKTPYLGDLKSFCTWMNKVTAEEFITEKWEHLDIYKMAAYWIYLMRHAGADQFVKNAMFTSEDGEHFYFIHYDNDTINGLINSGYLRIKPTDGRQTVDDTGSYVFAGHDSRLWNLLEGDSEFISIVSEVDNALYSAGISYANTIRIFDNEQADKWVEKVYNQDAQYKYIGPYVEKGVNNLFMLQGKRDIHRRWWLAKRFSIYDAKYVSGSYKSQAVEIKCLNGTEAGQKFRIRAGYPLDYGYGINNIPRSFGIPLEIGDYHEFTTQEVINIGDPLRIYGAPNIAEIDFSKMADRLAVVTVTNVYEANLGTKLTKLILGNLNKVNAEVSEISGLKQAISLEELDIQGMTKMNSVDLSNHQYFKKLKAFGSGLSSATFTKGAPIERLELPSSLRTLTLNQLPYLTTNNIIFEDNKGLQNIEILECPSVSSDFDFIYNWYSNKTSTDLYCSVNMDSVLWENIDIDKFLHFIQLKQNGTLELKGKVSLPNATLEQIYAIRDVFGDTTFYPTADFYVDVPSIIGVVPERNTILEGETIKINSEIYPVVEGTFVHTIIQSRNGCYINENSELVTTETAIDTSDIIIRTYFYFANSEDYLVKDTTVTVERRVYPSSIEILGNPNFTTNSLFSLVDNTEGVNGIYTIQWILSGKIAEYYHITTTSEDNTHITLIKDTTPPDTTLGSLAVKIIRDFDNTVIESRSLDVRYDIIWPQEAVIWGNENPIIDGNYSVEIFNDNITGEFYIEWEITGNVTNYVYIASYSSTECELGISQEPFNTIAGQLVCRFKKSYNNEIALEVTKDLKAILPGVVINSVDNAPIQSALYNNGLVAHENYSLKEEVEKITASQLQTGTGATTSIFYNYRASITHFEEFEYFTGVTRIPVYCFSYLTKMTTIKLPNTITTINQYAFGVTNITGAGISSIVLPDSVKTLDNFAFTGCQSLKTVIFNDTLTTIGNSAFTGCKSLNNITLPNSLSSLGESVFNGCTSLSNVFIPDSITNIKYRMFYGCTALKTFVMSNAVTTLGSQVFLGSGITNITLSENLTALLTSVFSGCKSLQTITLPAKISSIGDTCFSGCTSLKEIICQRNTAPTVTNSTFGTSDSTYTGRDTYSQGINFLRISQNATGYEESYWGRVLLDPAKCGYSIHGGLTIKSNKLDAIFNLTYTSVNNEVKNINIPVGTIVLEDIKYDTEITIVVTSVGNGEWDWLEKKVIFNGNNDTFVNNCYVYPTSISIEGTSIINSEDVVEYSAVLSPSDTDVPVTYTWTLSSQEFATIESNPDSNSCIVTAKTITSETSIDLLCVATTPDGRSVQATKTIQLKERPNFILARYRVTSASPTQLLYSSFKVADIEYMEVDGVAVSPATSYPLYEDGGLGSPHEVRFTLKTLERAFKEVTELTEVDFNECDGSKYSSLSQTFYSSSVSSVSFGNCRFPKTNVYQTFYLAKKLTSITSSGVAVEKIINSSGTFEYCSSLVNINLSFIGDASETTSVSYLFYECTALQSIDWGNLKFSSCTDMNRAFYNCVVLGDLSLAPFAGAPISSLEETFWLCRALVSIDLTPFTNNTTIKSLKSTFYYCTALKEIDLTPLAHAPIVSLYRTFQLCKALTTLDLSPLEEASIKDMAYTFSNCLSLTTLVLPQGTAVQNVTSLESTFFDCSSLISIDLTFLKDSTITNWSYTFAGCKKMQTITVPWTIAPTIDSSTFGLNSDAYTGRASYNMWTNKIIVPVGATGYDEGYWGSVALDNTKCGFLLSTPRENGKYIHHINGMLYTQKEWESKKFDNTKANGVALLTNNASFVVSKERVSGTYQFGGYGISISKGTYCDSEAEAIQHYSGKEDTDAIIQALTGKTDSQGVVGSPAATAAKNYKFPNGRDGYLGSTGEWQLIKENFNYGGISGDNIFSIIGAELPMAGSPLSWTSTLYDTSNNWAWKAPNSANDIDIKRRYDELGVRALSPL